MGKEVALGAVDQSIFCVYDSSGSLVDADALPVVSEVFVNGVAVALPVPAIAQALDTGSVPITGTYFLSTDTSTLSAEDQVIVTFTATVGGLVRGHKLCFTAVDRAASLPYIETC